MRPKRAREPNLLMVHPNLAHYISEKGSTPEKVLFFALFLALFIVLLLQKVLFKVLNKVQ